MENDNSWIVYFISLILLVSIIAGGMGSMERDYAMKEKMDSITVQIDSLRLQLNKLNDNE